MADLLGNPGGRAVGGIVSGLVLVAGGGLLWSSVAGGGGFALVVVGFRLSWGRFP